MTDSDDDSTGQALLKFSSQVCLQCGYSLVGLPSSGTCPECGRLFGDEVNLVGFQSPRSDTKMLIASAVILIAIGFVNWIWLGFFTCCSAPFIALGVYMGWVAYRTHKSLAAIGGDLRWVIDRDGIRTVRFQKSEIQLLPWSQITNIRVTSSFSLRKRRWRSLRTRRSFVSLDLARVRAQAIWFPDVSLQDMTTLRKHVLELKKKRSV